MNIVYPIKDKSKIALMKKILSKNQRNLLLFDLGINSGLRVSDILGLDIKDVKNKSYIELREKKTNKFKRFPINLQIQNEISNFITDRNPDEPLFVSQKGNRLSRVQIYKILNRAAKKAEINVRIGTHSLRKTFGYHHYKQFDDIVLLQKILNHSSTAVTLRYIGLEQETIDKSYNNFYL
ncbi:MAG: tyrosine-type recombinase/integrase [Candidatus Gastranaerophilales bacterium]|nr:tyrosine-type recombinase/integrase [Candidatus Gastranaerophilales bacterium]